MYITLVQNFELSRKASVLTVFPPFWSVVREYKVGCWSETAHALLRLKIFPLLSCWPVAPHHVH